MKRVAVLIQSPLSGRDYLSGVGVDIASWQSFLTSLPGGAWNDDEIVILKNPSKTTLKSSLILAKYSDFAIIAFSGHGFVQEDEFLGAPETFLYLNESEDRRESVISEYELNPGTPRCVLSFDCCRKIEPVVLAESVNDEADFSRVPESVRESFRIEYEHQVMRCEKGCTRLYAASLDESASDRPSFTQILTAFAKKWSLLNPHKSMNFADAMSETTKVMKMRYHLSQTPVYNGGRRLNHFPIVVG